MPKIHIRKAVAGYREFLVTTKNDVRFLPCDGEGRSETVHKLKGKGSYSVAAMLANELIVVADADGIIVCYDWDLNVMWERVVASKIYEVRICAYTQQIIVMADRRDHLDLDSGCSSEPKIAGVLIPTRSGVVGYRKSRAYFASDDGIVTLGGDPRLAVAAAWESKSLLLALASRGGYLEYELLDKGTGESLGTIDQRRGLLLPYIAAADTSDRFLAVAEHLDGGSIVSIDLDRVEIIAKFPYRDSISISLDGSFVLRRDGQIMAL